MILFLFFLEILNEILNGMEKNPFFVAKFTQELELFKGEKIFEKGEIIFNFKKGIKFKYENPEKIYMITEEGFYSKEGGGELNFSYWDKESREYKFYILLLKGKLPEDGKIEILKEKKVYKIISEDPVFEIEIERENFYPLKFLIKYEDGTVSRFEFSKHKRIFKEIFP